MKKELKKFHHGESGQVLVVGLFILIILLLLVFAGFDIHNALRARFKIQTAQESAALTGATWQKHSLNLIGEINLVKACSILMEGDNANWSKSLPDRSKPVYRLLPTRTFNSLRKEAIHARIAILTEMQTRISFIGPLIGFAAAQQAAKANGIPVLSDLKYYIEELDNSQRYEKKYINNYEWKPAYKSLLETISNNGIAVYPNTTAHSSPRFIRRNWVIRIFIQPSSPKMTKSNESTERRYTRREVGIHCTDLSTATHGQTILPIRRGGISITMQMVFRKKVKYSHSV